MSILGVAVLMVLGVALSLSARRMVLDAWPQVVSALGAVKVPVVMVERPASTRAPVFVRPPMSRRTNLPPRIAA